MLVHKLHEALFSRRQNELENVLYFLSITKSSSVYIIYRKYSNKHHLESIRMKDYSWQGRLNLSDFLYKNCVKVCAIARERSDLGY